MIFTGCIQVGCVNSFFCCCDTIYAHTLLPILPHSPFSIQSRMDTLSDQLHSMKVQLEGAHARERDARDRMSEMELVRAVLCVCVCVCVWGGRVEVGAYLS